ncbi:MAG TPA: hypothetical protein VFY31_02625 [Macromonas sp.]|nr:hypothetical protein [Macromonas sp.]
MTPRTVQRLQAAASVALLLLWMAASHLGSLGVGNADLNVAVALAPVLAALGLLLWRQCAVWVLALVGVAVAAVLVWLWPLCRSNVAALYYLQHLGIHLMLAVVFGKSLRGPGDALVTSMARFIFPDELSARNVRYTRGVTLAWTLFFCANALVSTVLFWWAPTEVWSFHANLMTGPLVGLMFLCEHLVRYRFLPPHERPSLAMVARAWRAKEKNLHQPGTTP